MYVLQKQTSNRKKRVKAQAGNQFNPTMTTTNEDLIYQKVVQQEKDFKSATKKEIRD